MRRTTKQIYVGALPVGGDAPISVQSMCNTDTRDVAATVYIHTHIYIQVILVPALEVVQPPKKISVSTRSKKDKVIQQTIEEPL